MTVIFLITSQTTKLQFSYLVNGDLLFVQATIAHSSQCNCVHRCTQTTQEHMRTCAVNLLVLLMILCAACFGHEPLCQFLQVPGILRFNLSLFPEEVLQVLKQLDSHLRLLFETALLLHQLGPYICKHKRH